MAADNENVESPEYDADDELKEDQRAWQEEFEARKREIRRFPAVHTLLDTLKRAGADVDKILSGLALVATDHADAIKAMLKSRERHLSALAHKLEHVSTMAGDAIADPLNSSSFFSALMIPYSSEKVLGVKELQILSNHARRRVKPILDLLRAEARQFGRFSRNYDKIMTIAFMGGLLSYVKESTGQFHDQHMADLLQAAHDAQGIKASFTAEKLRKVRLRNLPHLVRKRKMLRGLEELYGTFSGVPLGQLDKT